MSNTYRFNVLTIDGAALIAQATAANPIVYVGALSKATAAASATELATAPASWYTGKAGEIVAVSATGNIAEIRAVWRNAGQPQLAKSVAVTALDDLETVHNAFIEYNNDDFEMQFSAFEAQEKVEAVLRYIEYLRQAED